MAPTSRKPMADILAERNSQGLLYPEIFRRCLQKALGQMYEYATQNMGFSLEKFHHMFLRSRYVNLFNRGLAAVGYSGIDYAYLVRSESLQKNDDRDFGILHPMREYTADFWVGWVLVWYHWTCGIRYEDIERYVPIPEIRSLHFAYHSLDMSNFGMLINDYMEERSNGAFRPSEQFYA